LLLISYHFTPAQTAGALRWEKFCCYASERGWAMDIVTLAPSNLSVLDTSRLMTLPPATRVYGIEDPLLPVERLERSVWRGYRRIRSAGWMADRRKGPLNPAPAAVNGSATSTRRAHSLAQEEMRWTLRNLPSGLRRAYYAWVDYARQRRWARAAADLCLQLRGSRSYAGVISCGPPHMAHEAGRRVAAATGLPFVMDLRDPWSLVQRLPEAIASPAWLALAARYERQAIASAALVVTNTEQARAALQAKYSEARSHIVAVTNGYDEDVLPESRHGRRFTIAYAGAMYLDRDPRILFRAAAQVVRELALYPSDFGIELMGDVETFDGTPTEVIAAEEGLDGFVGLRPLGTRREASEFLAQGSLLVSLPQDSDLAIPSKIFEYMQYDAWVLALADRGSATESLLRDSDADVVAPRDVDGLAAAIRKRYQQYASGERPKKLTMDRRFSRREQARRLFDAIDACMTRPATAGLEITP
jgi:glycosyltransferase involved in cell wall biosynthesis